MLKVPVLMQLKGFMQGSEIDQTAVPIERPYS